MKNQDPDAIPSKLYYREYMNPENNEIAPIETTYKTNDRSTLNYLRTHDLNLPYSINTVHLQKRYKSPSQMEGYAARENFRFKPTSIKDTTLRSRYNKNAFAKRESPRYNQDDVDDDDDKRAGKSSYHNVGKIVATTLKQYSTNTSLHGLHYIGDSSYTICERIFWLIACFLALMGASYYIWSLYRKWVESPIIISLSPEPVSLNEFPFPSVTICNMNNVKKSEANRVNAGNDARKKMLLEDMCNFDNGTTSFDPDQAAVKWENVMHFMINVSQSCTEMLHLCKWHGNITDCEKIFNPTMTDEGMCCNFNSVHKKYLFYNPKDWSDLNVTFPYKSIDWNPETGYGKDVPPDSMPWRPYGAGQFYGLTLVLDANIEEYYCSSSASVGFKMLLHNPVETPKIADFAFTLTPGEETRVIVSPEISTARESILSIPQKKRKCFFTSERKLRYYRTYTQRNCVLECEANFTQKTCDCVQYYMPKSSNTLICEKKDDACATNARRAMEVKLYDDESGITSINVSETPSCNCYPGCYEINYKVQVSAGKLVPSFAISDGYIKKDKKYFTENMAVVHLFFVGSQFTKYVKDELFGFTEFLSSTGGLLGLFMGFSIISLVEVIYFLTLRLWYRFYKMKDIPPRQTFHVQPYESNKRGLYPYVH